MTESSGSAGHFNVMVVGQDGRVGYEAALFAASLRRFDPGFAGTLYVAEPRPGPLWSRDPRMQDPDLRRLLIEDLGATILPFDSRHFGEAYPYGNKIEALAALPEGEPFVFFDSDTLITGPLSRVPFDFDRPTASLNRTGTWPVIELYGPGYTQTWRALYDRFGLDFESSLDLSQPEEFWKRYLYFNAGWFFHRCPREFGRLFLDYALSIRDDPPPELVCQRLDPWLDQVALPLVIHALGGGRDTLPEGLLDGTISRHYRLFPLLYARESDATIAALEQTVAPNRIKKVLKRHEPIRRMVLQGRGRKVRALFDQAELPRSEAAIRNRIKKHKLWMR
ncbi:hypothetical protein [Tranquillimonas alkanivorans]|uniref:Uncharacterized protein n=1 Tax=Tranquillimonas alkanivorans TaxID=441119 RepID=A0A1I5QZK2_9RHOB|nr:hypothetical protein [Tranquillimonas alkanivorans]SFP51501.1 hypothetical protein SAMN04488047_107189 [Tranquillimonas alkanivorans]